MGLTGLLLSGWDPGCVSVWPDIVAERHGEAVLLVTTE